MTPISNIRPAKNEEVAKANQILAKRQATPPRVALPDQIKEIRDEYIRSGGAITIEFEGENLIRQAENTSRSIRGHLTHQEFGLTNLSLTIIDEETDPKVVMKRKGPEK